MSLAQAVKIARKKVNHNRNCHLPKTNKRQVLFALWEETCFYCRERIPYWKSSIDHLIPLAEGGSNSLFNLVLACHSCNSVKANRLPTHLEIQQVRLRYNALFP